jgi:signal transduction histidine kinase
MKKKIIIGLSLFTLVFSLLTVYIITNIETTTSRLDNLVRLHQIEILREHLLIHISRVQAELRSAGKNNAIVTGNLNNMINMAGVCFNCHHEDNVKKRLVDLNTHIRIYGDSVRQALTFTDNTDIAHTHINNAFKIGEALIVEFNNMLTMTNRRLDEKTRFAREKIAATKTTLYMILALGPVFAVILSLIFIKSVTSPLKKILTATRRLKTGDLDFRVERLRDEFGEVADSINEMASSLKQQMRSMQRTEQLRMSGEIATGLAHEIKNPLAGIKISMEFLAQDSSLSEGDREVLTKVIDEVRRIEVLLRGLLNFAKPPVPHFAPAKINHIIDICIMFSIRTPSHPSSRDTKEVTVVKNFDDNIPTIMADQLQLQQVLLNLLLNAIDAMPRGGVLTINTASNIDNGSIKIEIADSGQGISDKDMNKIFQPFFTTKSRGTGMGLAITRRIIEEHGGSISVSSEYGRGTTFTIVLPVEQTTT